MLEKKVHNGSCPNCLTNLIYCGYCGYDLEADWCFVTVGDKGRHICVTTRVIDTGIGEERTRLVVTLYTPMNSDTHT